MLQEVNRHQLNNVGENEYGFFVKRTNRKRDDETGIEFNFENWQNAEKGTKAYNAISKHCFVISVDKLRLKTFIETSRQIYEFAKCVKVPEGENIDEINAMMVQETRKSKTALELEQEKNAELLERLEALEKNANIKPKQKRTKKIN
jgi:hypothetical protein